MEGKERQANKSLQAELGEGTAIVLRLCEAYFGTARIVHADIAFSSVKTTLELLSRGLYFVGIVKTAHKEYPKAHMNAWVSGSLEGQEGAPARGAFHLLESSSGSPQKLYALVWNDKKSKQIIATCGTTNPGNPSVRPRHKIVESFLQDESGELKTVAYTKIVQRPQMIELFFKYFSTIDVHDHFRQGSLGMERAWLTHSWWHRLFATLFAMTFFDSFLGYRHETLEAHGNPVELNEFIGKLAYQLIFNEYLQDGPTMRCCEAVPGAQEVYFALTQTQTQTQTQHFGRWPLFFIFFVFLGFRNMILTSC